jgi:hypothetical protein
MAALKVAHTPKGVRIANVKMFSREDQFAQAFFGAIIGGLSTIAFMRGDRLFGGILLATSVLFCIAGRLRSACSISIEGDFAVVRAGVRKSTHRIAPNSLFSMSMDAPKLLLNCEYPVQATVPSVVLDTSRYGEDVIHILQIPNLSEDESGIEVMIGHLNCLLIERRRPCAASSSLASRPTRLPAAYLPPRRAPFDRPQKAPEAWPH